MKLKNCKICGKELLDGFNRYCSVDCMFEGPTNRIAGTKFRSTLVKELVGVGKQLLVENRRGEKILKAAELNGRVKSIGKKRPTKEPTERDIICHRYYAYNRIDKDKGYIPIDISIDEFYTMVTTNTCYYCGTDTDLGLDRIDNSRGHTKDNVVVACSVCNKVRNDMFSPEEMKCIGPLLREVLNDRN